eukprot:9220849-Pyramimonas_sp.AAC.1
MTPPPRYAAPVDRIGLWSQNWIPTLILSSSGSDFQQWMKWCVLCVTCTLRFYGFRDLLQCAADAISDCARRWAMAIELRMHAWYSGAIPRERLRQ